MDQPDFSDWIIDVMRLVENEREESARALFEQWYGDFLSRLQLGDLEWAAPFIYSVDDYLTGAASHPRAWILEEYAAFMAELSSRK